ncbi:MAG: glutamate--tRNA ligase family protein, partial [bacterium]|nr:glutamate--tRNA ligase family protein [bacterium]
FVLRASILQIIMSNVRVRIPPSPTGYCHVGTARMAVINYLFAKKNGGTIVFRSEDTDKERSTKEYETDIMDSLHWLGLTWDEFYRQSERTDVYRGALHTLVDSGHAYVSEEESKKEAGKMMRVVRLKNPGSTITFTDMIRGDITFDTAELGDFVIARSVDDALYHFAVVVDDAAMNITHVIRGDDHISNTPRQILILEALGFERPKYAHYPLLLGADKSKLSKRTGDTSVKSYRDAGYLPEAFLNYIAVLGWTPASQREILSLSEMINEFDVKDLHKSGAVFDMEKLRWFNRQYLTGMPRDEFAKSALAIMEEAVSKRGLRWSSETGAHLIEMLRERISVWEDVRLLTSEGELDYFFKDPAYEAALIPGKQGSPESAQKHLNALLQIVAGISGSEFAHPETIKARIWDYAAKEGTGAVLWPFRFALTGLARSPDPFFVASVLGKDTVLKRISAALSALRV